MRIENFNQSLDSILNSIPNKGKAVVIGGSMAAITILVASIISKCISGEKAPKQMNLRDPVPLQLDKILKEAEEVKTTAKRVQDAVKAKTHKKKRAKAVKKTRTASKASTSTTRRRSSRLRAKTSQR